MQSLSRTKKLFVHFVLDPIAINDTGSEGSFAARYGCLVLVQKVERLDVGALVSIRGIGRVKILKFAQADPYLKGEVLPIQDRVPESESELSSKIMAVKEALYSLNSLEMKLKAPMEASLQTRILNSLNWAENEPCFEGNESFIPSLAERLSFAALQPVSGNISCRSTQSELVKLQQEKLRAMDLKDTPQRLDNSIKFAKQNISMVAAKLAIQSLGI
ncbi:hypothetical protein HS088_TW18G00232 [Tripterygium wilfordii]|uniref:Lon N-terminal domain-containing protein n=1 Tax=Tripterygium wilfordii TaxID=458696 RepID=A0A7J7CBS1_TRIWF|nr:hypothetical protein HS088_TW18G00232 [Tripterygium wilfordii]